MKSAKFQLIGIAQISISINIMKSSFISKAMSCLFGSSILTIVNLLIVVFLARLLGPHDVGRYQLIISSAMIMGTIGTFGFHGSVVYFVCSKKIDSRVIFAHLLIVTIISSFLFFLISSYLFSFTQYFGILTSNELFISAFCVPLFLFFSSMSQIFVAKKEIFKYQLLQSVPRLLLLFFILVFLIFFKINFYNVLCVSVVSSFIGVLFVIFYLRNYFTVKINIKLNLLFEMFKFGSLMTMSYLIILLNNEAMNIFIGIYLPGDFVQIGYFSRAFRAANLLLIFSSALMPLIFSQLSSVDTSQRIEQLGKIQRVWFSLSFLIVILLWFFAKEIIVILFTSEFLPSVEIFRVLLFGAFIYSFISFFNIFHNASGNPSLATVIMLFNLIVLIIFSFILVPAFKSIGMAYSYVISMLATLFLSVYINWKKYNIHNIEMLVQFEDVKYVYKKLCLFLIKE